MTQILEKCFPNPDNGGQTAADSRDIFFFSAVNQELRSYLHASIRAHTHTHTQSPFYPAQCSVFTGSPVLLQILTAATTKTTITGECKNANTITNSNNR